MALRIVNYKAVDSGLGIPKIPSSNAPDSYFDRLAKLIPAEALALYGAGSAMFLKNGQGPENGSSNTGLWIVTVAAFVLAGMIRFIGTRNKSGSPQWVAVGIALLSFVFWLAALPIGARPSIPWANEQLFPALSLIWTFFAPYFYKGDAE